MRLIFDFLGILISNAIHCITPIKYFGGENYDNYNENHPKVPFSFNYLSKKMVFSFKKQKYNIVSLPDS